MALRPVTIRLSEGVWEAVQVEAQHLGISAAEFIREAAMARAAFTYARRDGKGSEVLERLYAAAQAFNEKYGQEFDPQA